eukprot:jgi/Bigna1/141991/aug1.66_g16699
MRTPSSSSLLSLDALASELDNLDLQQLKDGMSQGGTRRRIITRKGYSHADNHKVVMSSPWSQKYFSHSVPIFSPPHPPGEDEDKHGRSNTLPLWTRCARINRCKKQGEEEEEEDMGNNSLDAPALVYSAFEMVTVMVMGTFWKLREMTIYHRYLLCLD